MNNTIYKKSVARGDIYFADLPKTKGSSQWGERPVVILQNNTGNMHAPTVIVASMTTANKSKYLPTHVCINREDVIFESLHASKIFRASIIMFEQVHTLDKSLLKEKIGRLSHIGRFGNKFDMALMTSLGIRQRA